MYTQDEFSELKSKLARRWWIVSLPTAVALIAAIVLFVIGQNNRSEHMWMVTAALTVLSGGCFAFFYGVYVRPVRLYTRHVSYMLNGRKRETTGVFKTFADEMSDKEGIECYALLLNIGQTDAEEDDRLFYYDAHKPKPSFPLGTPVTVLSNDRMVADMQAA
ncbi:MAG: hypothetical protein RR653_00545 [Clostridia bacterium]